jgi:hypothetical protein
MGQIDDDIDGLIYSDFEDYADANPPRDVRCRRCGSEDVYWGQDGTGRWALYNLNSRKHVCKDGIISAIHLDAFNELDN